MLVFVLDRVGPGSVLCFVDFLPRRVVLPPLLGGLGGFFRSSAMLIWPCFFDDLILTYLEELLFGSGSFFGVSRFPRRDVVLPPSFVIHDVFDFSIPREQSQNSFGSEG